MKRTVAVALCLCLFITGCGLSKQIVASSHRGKLAKLEKGMTKEAVKKTMGRPEKTETYKEREFWFYYTAELEIPDVVHGVMTRSDSDYTPLGFFNDMLEGWGRDYYREKKIQ
jgi:outer membrane protein assembly factor BamE (lipoprotein component of BamABCDE complex)